MAVFLADKWQDYQVLDTGDGEKLERWGNILTIRPDPQIIWPKQNPGLWRDAHMRYRRSKSGGGSWEKSSAAASWNITYSGLRFRIRPTDFKHMGLFPEQASNWDWLTEILRGAADKKSKKVLNLFGYTGGATLAALSGGASVTHVDAAKGMNGWAKENIALTFGKDTTARILTDDVYKFVNREARRGNKYDGIILDPPSYGRGPGGEVWKLESKLYELLLAACGLLTAKPLFVLLNTYTAGFSYTAAENVLRLTLTEHGFNTGCKITSGVLGLPVQDSTVILPGGNTVRADFSPAHKPSQHAAYAQTNHGTYV